MSGIDANTNAKIRVLCGQGDKLSKLGDFDRAISKYYEALTLLPTLHERTQIAAFLYASIGEAYWNMKDYENAGESFCEAYECPGMNENAQITLRIGQCLTECGDTANARDYLRHAVRLGGEELIMDTDRKYYDVLYPAAAQQTQAPPQTGGVYASGITRGASPAAGRAGQQTFSYKDRAQTHRQQDAEPQQSAYNTQQNSFAQELQEPEQPVEIKQEPVSADKPAAAAAPGAVSESAFGFMTDVFSERPTEPESAQPRKPSKFEQAAEGMKGAMEPQHRQESFDMFNPGHSEPSAEAQPDIQAARESEDTVEQPKPTEKKGFFSRLFGKK